MLGGKKRVNNKKTILEKITIVFKIVDKYFLLKFSKKNEINNGQKK